MGAGAIAAIIIRHEKDLISHFQQMRAISPSSAQSVVALRVEQDRIFRGLERRAVIRQSPTGLYYLDEASWKAMRATRRRLVFVVVGIAIAMGVAVAYTAQARSGLYPTPTGTMR